MEIRKAITADLDAVEQSYIELLTNEQTKGSNSGWVLGVYPTRAWAEENLKNLWVLTEGETLGASMILNSAQPEDYGRLPWSVPAEPQEVFVIHTLCVPPSQAGRGYGKTMARFAIEEARRQGGRVIRLDTSAGNRPAAGLYEGLGFRLVGKLEVLHQGLIPETLSYYELAL